MKRLLLVALSTASLSAYALPTYEPFTEFNSTITSTVGTANEIVTTLGGVPVASANSAISNCLDLATGSLSAPSGESWTSLNFSATSGTNNHGLDIAVVTNAAIFPQSSLSSLLPSTFPGMPAVGQSITTLVDNPAQPLIGTPGSASANTVGNSAVLRFAQPVTRPASGTKTVYFSYLYNLAQAGQLGTGNNGRYLALLSSTNLVEGTNTPGGVAYTNWTSMFSTFPSSSIHYASHGLLARTGGYYIGACDSSVGKNWSTTALTGTYGTPILVVGEYVLNGSGSDTNIMWVNPATGSFGGTTPPAPGHALTMAFNMSDLGGLAFIDRVGSGAAGGVGTNYVANLIIGNTWSYVTGGPEFTNQPVANTSVNIGGSASLTARAAAAGQSVNYQWLKVLGGVTNTVSNGAGGAGGSATVSGANSSTLNLTGINSGDTGLYILVATASSTGFTLNSTGASLQLSDPQVTVNPLSTSSGYGQSASFSATVTTANAPLSYQWYFGSTPLNNGAQPDGSTAVNAAGTTGAGTSFTLTLSLNNVSYQDIGNYTLYVTNNIGLVAISGSAALSVFDPLIITPPANPTVADGGNATFSVVAAGSGPATNYQWYEGVTPLSNGGTTVGGTATVSGADTATLTLTGVHDADNGTYYCAVNSTGSGQTTNSPAATLTVQDALTIVSAPMSLTERVGDHVAFAVSVTGGGPSLQWYSNNIPISGATGSAIILTNIQPAYAATYSVVVSNLLTAAQTFSPTLTVLNSPVLTLAHTNLVVARVGDGAQVLSLTTGNTLYLDQYTVNGTYMNSSQIPDEATGRPYGTGSASSVLGSPALIVAGAGADAPFEAMLTLSGLNQEYLGFAGYCQAYPFSGGNVNAQPGTSFRGLATMNAFGIYNLAYTNSGLYSAGGQLIRDMVTLDGTNFWTIGSASAGTVKFVTSGPPGAPYANGSGVPSSSGVSGAGGRAIKIFNGPLPLAGYSSVNNLVVSDSAGPAGIGLYAVSGTPEPVSGSSVSFTNILTTGASQPGDFSISPDGLTVYVADAGTFTTTSDQTGGGIQRFDWNGSGYVYSYTLQPLGSSTVGAQGLTTDFSAAANWGPGITGAILYATTAGASSNSLVSIVDTGIGSVSTVLVTAGPTQGLRGVRFGPAAIAPVIISAPQNQTIPIGNNVSFSVAAAGSAPFYYQWSYNNVLLAGATQSSFTTNNISFASAGTYSVVVSNLTTQTASAAAVLTPTAGSPTVAAIPNYTETAGDHLAWGPAVTGTQPWTNYWYHGSTLLQSNVTPSANGSLSLANVQTGDGGTYTLIVSNFYGHASVSGTLTVTPGKQTLSPANIVVARVGDGAQTLSAATGNTLYLDQYTPGGSLVNTIQVPDQGTGLPYPTGGSSSASLPFGSQALLFAGTGPDAPYEAFLSLSPDGERVTFAGYCQAYPFAGPDVSVIAGGSPNWHGIAGVDAYGYSTMLFTNTGLYSAGGHQVHGAVDLYGTGTNFYSTGVAGAGNGIKYLNIDFEPASGGGIASVAGSFAGTRAAHIVSGNLAFSDGAASQPGIYVCSGLPTGPAGAALQINDPSSPMDFAASPDTGNPTIYIADNGAFTGTGNQAGGIQRWDSNGAGGYNFSYTLGTGSGSIVGARGLTVDFSAASTWGAGIQGAILYATTAEPSGNRLIKIVDNGASSTSTTVSTAAPNQMLAGVSFGPQVVAPFFLAQPQDQSQFAGSAVSFSADAFGSGPLTYQWFFQVNCTGTANPIALATNETYTIPSSSSANVGCYYVVATNPGNLTAQSQSATFTLAAPPQFISIVSLGVGAGYQLNFSGPANKAYSIWTSTDVTLRPIATTWTKLTTGVFSGGPDSFPDTSAGSNPEQFYIISVP